MLSFVILNIDHQHYLRHEFVTFLEEIVILQFFYAV